MRFGRMEFNARNSFQMTIFRLRECSWGHFNTVNLSSLSCNFISQHFKVILKHIDNFIGLESFFNSEGNSINKFIQFLFHLIITFEITHLSDKIISIILTSFVNTSSKVSLSLSPLNLTSCLQSHFKYLLSGHQRNVFNSTLHIHEVLRTVFLNKVETILAKESSLSCDSHLHERS